jgi:antitoxin component of MazEF toxin-antitoxin module
MKAQILKWGNSLAVRIPRVIAKGARLKAGDTVDLTASIGKLEIRRVSQTPTLSRVGCSNYAKESAWRNFFRLVRGKQIAQMVTAYISDGASQP